MSLSLQELRDEVREITGLDEDDLPNPRLDKYLNLAWWELVDKVDFKEKEGVSSFSTVAGQINYNLTTIAADVDNVRRVTIQSSTLSDFTPLDKTDYRNIEDNLSTQTYSRGLPEKYSRYNTQIYLYPIPDSVYTVRVLYQKTLEDIATAGVPIPQVWHEFIYLGGAMRAARANNEFQQAKSIRAERDGLILTLSTTEAKETKDYSYAGARIIRPRYP